MALKEKGTNLKPELLADEQVGGVVGGAGTLIQDPAEWKNKAREEQRETLMEGYVCPACGTANSTFASGKMGGWDPGPNDTTIPISNYIDCKCYKCGRQMGEISYFPNSGTPVGVPFIKKK